MKPIDPSDFKEPVSIASRRRGGKRPKLRTQDKIAIVHQVLCQHIPEKEVAKEFRISLGYLSRLPNMARRKPGAISEIVSE